MLTIKWTQPSGVINIIETKNASVLIPKTKAWDEYMADDSNLKSDKMRSIIMYDGGTIITFIEDARLYIVNSNGKTVQTA